MFFEKSKVFKSCFEVITLMKESILNLNGALIIPETRTSSKQLSYLITFIKLSISRSELI